MAKENSIYIYCYGFDNYDNLENITFTCVMPFQPLLLCGVHLELVVSSPYTQCQIRNKKEKIPIITILSDGFVKYDNVAFLRT